MATVVILSWLSVANTIGKYQLKSDPVFNNDPPEPIFDEDSSENPILPNNAINSDYGEYYNNYYEDVEFENDILTLYDEYHIDNKIWRDDLEWDNIQTLILQNDQKITKKCAQFQNDELFCLCQPDGYRAKYQCKENEPEQFRAVQREYNNYESDGSSSEELGAFGRPEDRRDTKSKHHIFNKALSRMFVAIDELLGGTAKYLNLLNFKIPKRLEQFDLVIGHRNIGGKAKALGITAGAAREALRKLNIGQLISKYVIGAGRAIKAHVKYLQYDVNAHSFGAGKAAILKLVKAMIDGKAKGLHVTKFALENEIADFLKPIGTIQITGLKRWKSGGVHDGKGARFGRRGYSISYPCWVDGPMLKYVFEYDGDGNPVVTVDDGGHIVNAEVYARWLLIKEIGKFLRSAFLRLPDVVEYFVKHGKVPDF
eukprot:464086_1